MTKYIQYYVMSLLLVGLVTMVAGFAGWLYPLLSTLLIIPGIGLAVIGYRGIKLLPRLGTWDKWLLSSLSLIWLSHLLQVFTPETGFDAVWYHLPVVEVFTRTHQIQYVPDMYQSLNPLFSDLYFLLGYQVLGDLGAKIVAYGFGLSLIGATYALSRQFLNHTWSIIAVMAVSLIQVVAWQAASFYIDVAKAMWEVAAVWMLIDRRRSAFVLSGLFFGAALASKLFTILLWPSMALIVWLMNKRRLRSVLFFIEASLLVVFPFYLYTYLSIGNPFHSLTLNAVPVVSLQGHTTLISYLVNRTVWLPWSLVKVVWIRDYLSLLMIGVLPMIVLLVKQKSFRDTKQLSLLIFGLTQWTVWWYLPPLSTRYALSGFIVLLVLVLIYVSKVVVGMKHSSTLMTIVVLVVLLPMLPRLYVNWRSLKYVTGQQNKTEYLQQFMDGWIDEKLKQWHKLTF